MVQKIKTMLDINKTLELLRLPQDMEMFSGQVNKCTRYKIVENRVTDFTNVENGKLKPKTTSTFTSVPTTVDFGLYNHNILASYVHSYDYEPVGFINNSYMLTKDAISFVVNGITYNIGWQEAKVIPTANGFDMRIEAEPSSTKISITRINTTITGSVSISKNGTVTVTNKKVTTGGIQYPSYTLAQLEQLTGWDEYQIAEGMATVFHMSTPSSDTHCHSIATDIVAEGNKLTGIVYINGIKSSDINFRQLISSYGKQLPDYVTRWKVYNPSAQSGVYGTALPVIQRSSTSNQDLNIVKGDVLSYDAATNTLTYTDNTDLVFDFEFLPAQGKNETWGSKIDLDTLIEDIF